MTQRKPVRVLLLMIVAFLPSLALAQGIDDPGKANTKGVFISAAYEFTSIEISDFGGESESGHGGSLQIGYGFSQRFAFILSVAKANIPSNPSDIALSHLDLGARYSFWKETRKLVPFLDVAASRPSTKQDDASLIHGIYPVYDGSMEMSGIVFAFGGGFHYYLRPKLALTTSVRWTNGKLDDVKLGGVSTENLNPNASTRRLTLGMSWFPN